MRSATEAYRQYSEGSGEEVGNEMPARPRLRKEFKPFGAPGHCEVENGHCVPAGRAAPPSRFTIEVVSVAGSNTTLAALPLMWTSSGIRAASLSAPSRTLA